MKRCLKRVSRVVHSVRQQQQKLNERLHFVASEVVYLRKRDALSGIRCQQALSGSIDWKRHDITSIQIMIFTWHVCVIYLMPKSDCPCLVIELPCSLLI